MAFPKVTVKQELFQKLGQDSEGRYTTGLTISLINLAGTYESKKEENKGQELPYSTDKIRLQVSKLDYKDGSVKHTVKVSKDGTPYSAPDVQKVDMSIDLFKEFLFQSSDILEAI